MRVVIAALLLVLVAGCSSDPEPKQPQPSASPTVSAPTMPEQAKEDSDEGAAAFVDHYVQVLNYAAATGDVEELSRLSSDDCGGCQSYIDLYRDTYAAGGYFKDSDWEIGDLRLLVDGDTTYVTTVARTEPGPYRESSSSSERMSSGQDNEVSFAAVRNGSDWHLTQLGLGGIE